MKQHVSKIIKCICVSLLVQASYTSAFDVKVAQRVQSLKNFTNRLLDELNELQNCFAQKSCDKSQYARIKSLGLKIAGATAAVVGGVALGVVGYVGYKRFTDPGKLTEKIMQEKKFGNSPTTYQYLYNAIVSKPDAWQKYQIGIRQIPGYVDQDVIKAAEDIRKTRWGEAEN